jgi:arylsulfatase
MKRKPNILVIMPDTFRWDSLGSAGHPAVKTPNIDRIASMGVRFSAAYSSSPVCMPARTNCMSGLYCHNTGQWNNYGRFPAEAPSYMRILQKNGYRTAHIGKSHFYAHEKKKNGEVLHLDEEKGFLQSMGHDDVFETTGPYATVGCDSILTDYWKPKGLVKVFRDDYGKRGEAGVFKSTWPSPLSEEDHADTFVCRTAIDYFRKRDKTQPFAAFIGIGGPHDPWDPPANWAEKFKDVEVPEPIPPSEPESWLGAAAMAYHGSETGKKQDRETWMAIRRLYYAKIAHVDDGIGKILDALEEQGDLDNTVIVFWSDHGDRLCDRGKCHKGVFYDESARVPLIVRLPGNPGAGMVCHSLVSINDIFPTLLDAAGVEKIMSFGKSLVPATRNAGLNFHEAVFSEIRHGKSFNTMIRTDHYKMVVNELAEVLQLFDVKKDIREMLNLAGRADMHSVECELKEQVLEWRLWTESDQVRRR